MPSNGDTGSSPRRISSSAPGARRRRCASWRWRSPEIVAVSVTASTCSAAWRRSRRRSSRPSPSPVCGRRWTNGWTSAAAPQCSPCSPRSRPARAIRTPTPCSATRAPRTPRRVTSRRLATSLSAGPLARCRTATYRVPMPCWQPWTRTPGRHDPTPVHPGRTGPRPARPGPAPGRPDRDPPRARRDPFPDAPLGSRLTALDCLRMVAVGELPEAAALAVTTLTSRSVEISGEVRALLVAVLGEVRYRRGDHEDARTILRTCLGPGHWPDSTMWTFAFCVAVRDPPSAPRRTCSPESSPTCTGRSGRSCPCRTSAHGWYARRWPPVTPGRPPGHRTGRAGGHAHPVPLWHALAEQTRGYATATRAPSGRRWTGCAPPTRGRL
ncbi:hypothetical protein NKG94_04900 [Micromonospora sp. M12]